VACLVGDIGGDGPCGASGSAGQRGGPVQLVGGSRQHCHSGANIRHPEGDRPADPAAAAGDSAVLPSNGLAIPRPVVSVRPPASAVGCPVSGGYVAGIQSGCPWGVRIDRSRVLPLLADRFVGRLAPPPPGQLGVVVATGSERPTTPAPWRRATLDAESAEWVRALSRGGAEQERAATRLHEILLRIAWAEVHRRSGRV
jgi:hypothetical protein